MTITVYGPYYASSKRVIACLFEKGLEYEVVPVDIFKGENKELAYRQLQVSFCCSFLHDLFSFVPLV